MTHIAASGIVAFVVAIGIVGVTAIARVAATCLRKPLWVVPVSSFSARNVTSSPIPIFVICRFVNQSVIEGSMYLHLGSSWQRPGPEVKVDYL